MATENTSDTAAPDTIVLVHGLWVTPLSWEKWVEHYEGKGYRVLAPAYPGLEVEVNVLREDPLPIEALTVPAIIEHYEGIIDGLDGSPIIMGHSAGGLFTQILLDRSYGAAGVAIDSMPAEGVKVIPVSQIRALFPILSHPSSRHRAGGFTKKAVPLRLREHPLQGGLGRGLRALLRPRLGQSRVGGSSGQLHVRPPGHLRELPQRGPGALAVHCGRRR